MKTKVEVLFFLREVIIDELFKVFDLNDKNYVIQYMKEVGLNYCERNKNEFELTALSDIDLIIGTKQIFSNLKFYDNFGGKPWSNICQIYIDVEKEPNINQERIDIILNTKHNTGILRDKIKALPADNKEK